MAQANWIEKSQTYVTNTLGQVPDQTLNIPAGGRLVKFVTEPFISTQASWSQTNPNDIRPLWLQSYVELQSTDYGTRKIFQNQESPDFSVGALWEGTVREPRVGTRMFFMAQAAGSRHWGTVQDCSYGGLGGAAITLRFHVTIAKAGTSVEHGYQYAGRFRALYIL